MEFYFTALSKFGYENKLILMIQVSYPIIQSKIKINGFLSSPITVIQGVHQGYPLSLLLYIIAAKVLPIFIDSDARAKGVQIRDHEMKMLNLVDGTTSLLTDINYLSRIKSILKLYKKVASSKMNFSKTQAL